MKFREWKRRGQVMVLWALLTPLLICFVGAGMDLGWYYLNVSRLQNAADAAALAGAQALANGIDNEYYVMTLTGSELPADKLEYEKIYSQNFGTLQNYKDESTIKAAVKNGRIAAEEYTRKNLADSKAVNASSNELKKVAATDGWSVSSAGKDKEVSGTVNIYAKRIDVKNDILGPMYYVVELKESIRHFFLPGWFNDMVAPVKSVVLLHPHHDDLIYTMQNLDREEIIGNWEEQNYNRTETGSFYEGKWNHYQAGNIKYAGGDTYRTESVSIKGNADLNKEDGSSGTSANNPSGTKNYKYKVGEVDSLNIDFRADEWKKVTNTTRDFDLLSADEANRFVFQDGWSKNVATNYRILFTANFDEPYPTRISAGTDPDPLWIRIEKEPIKSLASIDKSSHMAYNSVRQITLNINKDNTTTEKKTIDGKEVTVYKYRPLFIFYTGPEKLNAADVDENGKHVRDSQPLVLNLNTNFNGVIYAPESPVIINGNGKTWKGFIIAKEFLAAKTIDDFTTSGYKQVTDNYADHNTLLVKLSDLKSKNDLDIAGGGYINALDSAGNIVQLNADAPNYVLVDRTIIINKDGKTQEYKCYAVASALKDEADKLDTDVKVTYNGETKYISLDNLHYRIADTSGKDITERVDNKDVKTYYDYNISDYVEVTVDGNTIMVHVNDIVKTFRKVTYGNSDMYFDEDVNYYQVIWQKFNKKDVNPAVYDKTGNIQTKALPEDSYYKNDVNHPLDDAWNKIVDGEEYRVYTDTEKIEVVYHRSAFNLKNDSYYSSFKVKDLIRRNYTYLELGDSPDMFFTTRRAKWVD